MTIQQWNTKSLGTDYRHRAARDQARDLHLPPARRRRPRRAEGHGRPQLPEAGQAGRPISSASRPTKPRSSRSTGIRRRSRIVD
ncbi:MAG: hypothetical protein MZV64_34090 [Ignavibacteriales bacterium]|nr:hypothetical protein [Ignavibacteriales bacterium]